MDRETLVTFLTIVSTNSVSRAAEQLYVSQSSVSKRLQQLETELGVSLIVRKKGTRGQAPGTEEGSGSGDFSRGIRARRQAAG